MKPILFVAIAGLAAVSCRSGPGTAGKNPVVTPTGRKETTTQQYSLKQVEEGPTAAPAPGNTFDVQHPVYPSKKELEELKQHFQASDRLWYFRGLDSGWAVVRSGQVVWVLVTSHEY